MRTSKKYKNFSKSLLTNRGGAFVIIAFLHFTIKGKKMKDFDKETILKYGRKIIDIIAKLLLVLVFIEFIVFVVIGINTRSPFTGIIMAILISAITLITLILSLYMIYIFIDIRDNLKEINEKLTK